MNINQNSMNLGGIGDNNFISPNNVGGSGSGYQTLLRDSPLYQATKQKIAGNKYSAIFTTQDPLNDVLDKLIQNEIKRNYEDKESGYSQDLNNRSNALGEMALKVKGTETALSTALGLASVPLNIATNKWAGDIASQQRKEQFDEYAKMLGLTPSNSLKGALWNDTGEEIIRSRTPQREQYTRDTPINQIIYGGGR